MRKPAAPPHTPPPLWARWFVGSAGGFFVRTNRDYKFQEIIAFSRLRRCLSMIRRNTIVDTAELITSESGSA